MRAARAGACGMVLVLALATGTAAESESASDVIINELLASNGSGLTDASGERPDWIELYNRGEAPVNLQGWALSDDPDWPDQWVFPDVELESGAYLVVMASGRDKPNPGEGEHFHTNFQLSRSGEGLGLYRPGTPPEKVDGFAEGYPVQRRDHSYGRNPAGEWRYYREPSPGEPNGDSPFVGITEPPRFTVRRGFFEHPFQLRLRAEAGAEIRFRTDGGEPAAGDGSRYTEPLWIDEPTILRATAVKPDHLPSRAATQTYLVGVGESIRSLPVLSVTTAPDNLWGETGIMETDPRNTTKRGREWERPASAEWIEPAGEGFQIDAGLRLHGGNYVRERYGPNQGLPFRKYSFRLYFRGEYGDRFLEYPVIPETTVPRFKRLVLRAGMNDHTNPFVVDELVRRLSADMGHPASRGTIVNYFLNGEYQGYYNPTERIDRWFLRSHQGGGLEWDLIKQFGEVQEGRRSNWEQLKSLVVQNDPTDPEIYDQIRERLDLVNYIDYLLLNIYAGTGDWPHNNWQAARERALGGRFRFLVWDAEWAFGNQGRSLTVDVFDEELHRDAPIANFYHALKENPEFRLLFADRAHRHFFHDGALTRENVRARFAALEQAMAEVLPDMDQAIPNRWIPIRQGIVMGQLKARGLFRSATAPELSPHGGPLAEGETVTMEAPEGGTIHYTLNGGDPRGSPTSVNQSLTLIHEEDRKRVIVPSKFTGEQLIGDQWRGADEPFNDSGWIEGRGGVGYEANSGYEGLIGIDLRETMEGRNTSAYIRIPFEVSDLEEVEALDWLKLRVRYDDGFVAYLNGVRVAAANAPADPTWESAAISGNSDSQAVNPEAFDISEAREHLRSGENILAVHGLNVGLDSSDFLNSVRLVGGHYEEGGPTSGSHVYSEPIELRERTRIRARTLHEGEWSALTEADFQVGPFDTPLRITEIMYHPPRDEPFEFLEIYNTAAHEVDLSRLAFDGIDYRFPAYSSIGPGESLVLASGDDPVAFQELSPEIWDTFGGGLANGGETLTLRRPTGEIVLRVRYDDAGGWPVEADGEGASLQRIDLEGDPSDPANWQASPEAGGDPGTWSGDSREKGLRIHELMALNQTAVEESGDFPDWIELMNEGRDPVSLAGWGLTDDGDRPRRFTFSDQAPTLEPGESRVLWCNGDEAVGEERLPFALDREGEAIFLFDPDGRRVDAVTFGRQLADYSVGRDSDGKWRLNRPTPGAPNEPADTASPDQLVLNEWLMAPVEGEGAWVELYNRSDENPAPLKGLTLGLGDQRHVIRKVAFLAPGARVVVSFDGEAEGIKLPLAVTGEEPEMALYGSSGRELDRVSVRGREPGVSQGRWPDGTESIRWFDDHPTPGEANLVVDYDGPIFNELLARESDESSAGWIELYNPSNTPWELADYAIRVAGAAGAESRRLPEGTTVAPGEWALVVAGSEEESLEAVHDREVLMWLENELPSRGGKIEWVHPEGWVADEVTYGFQLPGASIGQANSRWALLAEATPGSANSESAELGSVDTLRFSEWLASAPGGSDWFELYNRADRPVALEGLYITDDPSVQGRGQFRLGPLSFIGPDDFVFWWADGGSSPGGTHAPFRLDRHGEQLRLYNSRFEVIDEVFFGEQIRGLSQGRLSFHEPERLALLATPTPGEVNDEELETLPEPSEIPKVLINEWLAVNEGSIADPVDGEFDDWFELYNAGDDPVDLSAYTLSDDLDDPERFRIPNGTTIPANGHLLIWADGEPEQTDDSGQIHTNFRLSRDGEAIGLWTPDGEEVDRLTFGEQAPDVSQGRLPDGEPSPFVSMELPTPGASNTGEEAPSSPTIDPASIQIRNDGSVRFSWEASPGATYEVQYKNDLRESEWKRLEEVSLPEAGAVTTDRSAADDSPEKRFYRIKRID